MIVNSYQGDKILLERLVKMGRKWVIIAKIWETLVDCSDILDVVEFDLLQILLLVYFSCISDALIEFLVRLAGC